MFEKALKFMEDVLSDEEYQLDADIISGSRIVFIFLPCEHPSRMRLCHFSYSDVLTTTEVQPLASSGDDPPLVLDVKG